MSDPSKIKTCGECRFREEFDMRIYTIWVCSKTGNTIPQKTNVEGSRFRRVPMSCPREDAEKSEDSVAHQYQTYWNRKTGALTKEITGERVGQR